jgi:microcystin-dependent protein
MNCLNIIQIIIIILLSLLYFNKNKYENFAAVPSAIDYSNIIGDLVVTGKVTFKNRNNGITMYDIFPSGTILAFYGSTIPVNWYICDGTVWTKNTSTGIWTSSPNKSYNTIPSITDTVLQTPNLTGRTIVGTGAVLTSFTNTNNKFGAKPFANNIEFNQGESNGCDLYILKYNEIPFHKHWVNSHTAHDCGDRGNAPVQVNRDIDNNFGYLSPLGGGDGKGHNNMQPFVVIQYIIKM